MNRFGAAQGGALVRAVPSSPFGLEELPVVWLHPASPYGLA